MNQPPDNPSRQTPTHVAIIMDGNGRWAGQRGLPRIAGHEAGTQNIRQITRHAAELGIQYLTLWAFSTENWRRPREEVDGLLRILANAIETETDELHRQGARLQHIGSFEGLDAALVQSIHNAVELTRNNDRIVLTLAFNYGGRSEIVHAVREIVSSGIPAEAITEETIERFLYTRGMPDPDLIIRTSGEYRTSNFLIWQGAYSEYVFTSVFWPDFGPSDLDHAIDEYQHRERRFGGVSASTPPSTIRV
jgi:undecaprenyl diphosphate synthase